MMPTLELHKLTVSERLELIGELWDSIDSKQQPEFSEEQLAELDKRLSAYQQDGNKGKPWSEIKARLKSQ